VSCSRLGNGVFTLELVAAAASEPLADMLKDFLWPWLISDGMEPELAVDLQLHLWPSELFDDEMRSACVRPFVLRASSAADFNLAVQRGRTPAGQELAWDPLRRVGYRVHPNQAKVDFFGDASSAFVHLIEFVRYYGLLVEQSRGTAVLHSAAVHRVGRHEVVAIAGVKGAGKTTTMLSLVAEGKHRYFSGDKVLLDVSDGRLRARGWPDFPHIGLGTLRQHPVLAEKLGVSFRGADDLPLPDRHKVLVAPSVFHRQVGKPEVFSGTLEQVILPRVHERAAVASLPVDTSAKLAFASSDLFEWPHEFVTATWHGLPATKVPASARVSESLLDKLRLLPWEFRYDSSAMSAAGRGMG
jgi:hypothetical protein